MIFSGGTAGSLNPIFVRATQLGQIVVEVHTDAGLVGSESVEAARVNPPGSHGAARLLLGRDATQVEELYREMYRHTLFLRPQGPGHHGHQRRGPGPVGFARQAGRPAGGTTVESKVDLAARIPTYTTVFCRKGYRRGNRRRPRAIKLHLERFGEHPDPAKIAEFGPERPREGWPLTSR